MHLHLKNFPSYRLKVEFWTYLVLEIKPCELGPRIRDVEAFWYKTEINIIYFVPLFFIVFYFMVYPDPKFLISFRARVNHAIRHNQHNQTQSTQSNTMAQSK